MGAPPPPYLYSIAALLADERSEYQAIGIQTNQRRHSRLRFVLSLWGGGWGIGGLGLWPYGTTNTLIPTS